MGGCMGTPVGLWTNILIPLDTTPEFVCESGVFTMEVRWRNANCELRIANCELLIANAIAIAIANADSPV